MLALFDLKGPQVAQIYAEGFCVRDRLGGKSGASSKGFIWIMWSCRSRAMLHCHCAPKYVLRCGML